MRYIRKKVWPEYFSQILLGQKTFELRINDFQVNPGDVLILEEWDPKTETYTGQQIRREVGFVGRFMIDKLFWPEEEIKEKGLLVISLLPNP